MFKWYLLTFNVVGPILFTTLNSFNPKFLANPNVFGDSFNQYFMDLTFSWEKAFFGPNNLIYLHLFWTYIFHEPNIILDQ